MMIQQPITPPNTHERSKLHVWIPLALSLALGVASPTPANAYGFDYCLPFGRPTYDGAYLNDYLWYEGLGYLCDPLLRYGDFIFIEWPKLGFYYEKYPTVFPPSGPTSTDQTNADLINQAIEDLVEQAGNTLQTNVVEIECYKGANP